MKDDKQCTMQLVIAMLVQLSSASRDSDHADEVRPVGLTRQQGLVLSLHVVDWCLLLALLALQLCQYQLTLLPTCTRFSNDKFTYTLQNSTNQGHYQLHGY